MNFSTISYISCFKFFTQIFWNALEFNAELFYLVALGRITSPMPKGTERKWSNDTLKGRYKESPVQTGSLQWANTGKGNMSTDKVPIFVLAFHLVLGSVTIDSGMLQVKRGNWVTKHQLPCEQWPVYVTDLSTDQAWDRRLWWNITERGNPQPLPTAVGSSVWLSATWGVLPTGRPQENCWLQWRLGRVERTMIWADRRVEMPDSDRSWHNRYQGMKAVTLAVISHRCDSSWRKLQEQNKQQWLQRELKVPASGHWCSANAQRGEMFGCLFLLLISKGWKLAFSD